MRKVKLNRRHRDMLESAAKGGVLPAAGPAATTARELVALGLMDWPEGGLATLTAAGAARVLATARGRAG